jgi:nucleotide-binding universal stress UspA family protein
MCLVSVVDPWQSVSPALAYPAAFSQKLYDDLRERAEGETQEMLATHARILEAEGIAVEKRILQGPIAPSIMAAIRPGDVVVMTSHGHGGVKRWFLGSVAEKLVRGGPAPVLLVPVAPTPAVVTTNSATAAETAVVSG